MNKLLNNAPEHHLVVHQIMVAKKEEYIETIVVDNILKIRKQNLQDDNCY
ncbi:hypothetical protein ALC152_15570 [Arcobacter sp. 15-2]